jgi:hypothetical protein
MASKSGIQNAGVVYGTLHKQKLAVNLLIQRLNSGP